ncbi:AI-2E family transporter [Oscillospiraceae bacterium MB08-C2-2]|nr:AI-2E family transporter [Oscillospiraceae bacterium MB08-C2-2]
MPLELKKKVLIEIGFWGISGLAAYLALRWLPVILMPLLIGLALAFLIRPFIKAVARGTRMGEKTAGIFCSVFFYLVVGFLLWATSLLLLSGDWPKRLAGSYGTHLGPFFQAVNSRITLWITRIAPGMGTGVQQAFAILDGALQSLLTHFWEKLAELLGGMVQGLPLFLLTLLFSVLASVMISMDFAGVLGYLHRQIPKKWLPVVDSLRVFITDTLLKMARGYLILAVILFAALALGFWILGIRPIWATSFGVALLDMLPALGSMVLLIPWGVFELIAGSYFQGIGLIVLALLTGIGRQVLEPKILGKQTGLHPLTALIAMYAGLRVGGFLGLLLAPLAVLVLRHLHRNREALWKAFTADGTTAPDSAGQSSSTPIDLQDTP